VCRHRCAFHRLVCDARWHTQTRWKGLSLNTLVDLATKLYSTQLVILSALLDVEWHYSDVLTRAINALQAAIAGGKVKRHDGVPRQQLPRQDATRCAQELDDAFKDRNSADGLRVCGRGCHCGK
jgi:hypothetical protein